ncbi:MAG: hypothetical protein MUO40_02710 [Anaerolineaceae bacterium]|nr:hypothetical protein [Anaerolineaceae bacterium]
MARILTKTQEIEIFKAVPASFTIETVAFTASKIYPNQMTAEHSSYPVVTINFSQDGLQGPLRDLVDGVPYYQSMMTIHVLAQNSGVLSGPVIARGIMQAIITAVSLWVTPITGGTHIFDAESDIHPMQNLGPLPDGRSIFDYVISIDIYHT